MANAIAAHNTARHFLQIQTIVDCVALGVVMLQSIHPFLPEQRCAYLSCLLVHSSSTRPPPASRDSRSPMRVGVVDAEENAPINMYQSLFTGPAGVGGGISEFWAFYRWNPLLEPVLEPFPALELPSSGPFQRTLPALEPLLAPLPAPPSSTAPPPPLFSLSLSLSPRYRNRHSAASGSTLCNVVQCIHVLHPMVPPPSVLNETGYNDISKL